MVSLSYERHASELIHLPLTIAHLSRNVPDQLDISKGVGAPVLESPKKGGREKTSLEAATLVRAFLCATSGKTDVRMGPFATVLFVQKRSSGIFGLVDSDGVRGADSGSAALTGGSFSGEDILQSRRKRRKKERSVIRCCSEGVSRGCTPS